MFCKLCGSTPVQGRISINTGRRITPTYRCDACENCLDTYFIKFMKLERETAGRILDAETLLAQGNTHASGDVVENTENIPVV